MLPVRRYPSTQDRTSGSCPQGPRGVPLQGRVCMSKAYLAIKKGKCSLSTGYRVPGTENVSTYGILRISSGTDRQFNNRKVIQIECVEPAYLQYLRAEVPRKSLSTWSRVPGTERRVPGTRSWVPSTEGRVPGTEPGTESRKPGTRQRTEHLMDYEIKRARRRIENG